MTSEQGNPPAKGEAPDDQSATDQGAVDQGAGTPETVAAEAGSTPSPAAEPESPAEAAERPAEEAPAPAAEEPTVDDGATQAMPTSALADADVPPAPAAEPAPEPEAPQAAPEPVAPQAAAEPEPPQAAPEPPAVDEGATQSLPNSINVDIPAAPAADAAPAQVPPASFEEPETQTPPPAPQAGGPQFDDDGTQILRLGPSQQQSPPAPAPDPVEESTQVLPPQGISGFNAPAPYGDQPQAGQPQAGQQQPVSPPMWPSPPPNPLANQGQPGQAAPQQPYQQPQQQPPQQPYQQQPQSAYQPPAAQQPPAQSDDTQKLIIGAHNPYSEPPAPPSAYGSPAQPAQSQPQMGPQYTQPGMQTGSVPPPGQYPTAPVANEGGGRKKGLVPILAVVGALVLIGAAVGVYFLLFAAPKFEEGGCVRHTSGDQAEAIECSEAVEGEDYEIVQKVGDGQECADAGRETLTVGEDVYCLSLLGGAEEGEGGGEASESPSEE
ncbi:hypothetical protein [Glycomyces albidus]|uniref:Uncharacterized protein n=1 Tax=Glycomyces albidus TaxID=2656774 RepID=A0A6L5G7Z1_9ACTN|nr:hypothetical protein [Glycomyces albidus]MQM25782.1 hypothetical protein [Glycomyces albidus]